MTHGPTRPPATGIRWLAMAMVLLLGGGIWLGPELRALWDAEAAGEGRRRLADLLGSFGAPDLSSPTLQQAMELALDTVSIGVLGTACAALLGYPLAILASRVTRCDGTGASLRWPARIGLEVPRLVLDGLRGVPDFAWALLITSLLGPGPGTAIAALALQNAGILGKVWSEGWDSIPPERYRALHSLGATPLQVFLHGVRPHGRPMVVSFLLMRTECAIRNASVIGVVSGGGLGAALAEELTFGNHRVVVTLLLTLLAVTACADLCANLIRRRLLARGRARPRLRRTPWVVLGGATLAVVWLGPGLAHLPESLARADAGYVLGQVGSLATPDLSWGAIRGAASLALVPVGMSILATAGAAFLAVVLSLPGSVLLQLGTRQILGEHLNATGRACRLAGLLVVRVLALVWRAIPEVPWLWIGAAFFGLGLVPAVLAMGIHSTGVLLRVFVEKIDDLPADRLARTGSSGRFGVWLYGVMPLCRGPWQAFTAAQFESNIRAGVVLGMVGAPGLGFALDTAMGRGRLHEAGTCLLAMVLLAVAVDRTSRWLQIGGPRRAQSGSPGNSTTRQ